ncbi:MAG: CBS domain-containing protein [Acidimicrobiales bacterium]
MESSPNPFHTVGKLFPADEVVPPVGVDAETPVVDALRLMLEKRFSQLTVEDVNGRLQGVFSLWSLARLLESQPGLKIEDLVVDDVLTQIPKVTVRDPLEPVLEMLDRTEAVLVVSPRGPQAIVTPWDVLDYYYAQARPFILLGEIEQGLRQLVVGSMDDDELSACIEANLGRRYADGRLPATVEELSFDELRQIICSRVGWPHFEGLLGRMKTVVDGRLQAIRDIRNDVFHFRGEAEPRDVERLAADREWVVQRLARMREVDDG